MLQHNGQVPDAHDPAVGQFLTKWGITATPERLSFTDYGYEPAFCHVSAKHRALIDGGKRVHGWALWKFGPDLVADHHSVWETSSGKLVDVTPPSNDGSEILFVRDDSSNIDIAGNDIHFFTQRTVDGQIHWLWQGKPSDYSNWPCPITEPGLVAYCAKLNIPVSAVATDATHG